MQELDNVRRGYGLIICVQNSGNINSFWYYYYIIILTKYLINITYTTDMLPQHPVYTTKLISE